MTVREKKSKTPNQARSADEAPSSRWPQEPVGGRRYRSRAKGEKGAALIIALLAITILMGIGFALLLSSSTESMIHGSFRRESLAFYAARGGLEEARGRMGPDAWPATTSPATSVKLPPCVPATPCPAPVLTINDAYYIRLNNLINPTTACTYLGMNCTDPNPPSGIVTFFPTTQPGTQMPYAWVKIELATEQKLNRDINGDTTIGNAPVFWDLRNLSLTAGTPPNPAYIFTALSIQPGRATRRLREVASLGKVPGLPGPLTLNGFPATYIPPTSNPFVLSGCDASDPAPCNAPPDAPSVILPTNTDRNTVQATILDGSKCTPVGPPMGGCQAGTPDRNADYRGRTNNGCTGGGCNSPNSASIVSATDATVFPSGNPLTSNPFFAGCAGVQQLQDYITQGADHIYNNALSTSIPDPGHVTPRNTVINVFNGNLTVAANDFCTSPGDCGAGIILVTGDLTTVGTPTYNGIIIVLGGSFIVGGGGMGTITGGILVADTSTCPGALGPATFDPSGGGNFTIQYDSTWANPQNGFLPMQILSLNY